MKMPFAYNRRLRLVAGVVALLFLAAPLSARGVDARPGEDRSF